MIMTMDEPCKARERLCESHAFEFCLPAKFQTSGKSSAAAAQTSRSAVSQVSKPARPFLFRSAEAISHSADLEIGDTAGLETCATLIVCFGSALHDS
jgi:hypothetical protein